MIITLKVDANNPDRSKANPLAVASVGIFASAKELYESTWT